MGGTSIATGYTHDFVSRNLPDESARVVEIGCGRGELAARLLEDGLEVVAVDSDAECVAAARDLGVDARQASWPTSLGERFDAVLFTRSLHHISPLEEAIDAAVQALRPGGRLIVEDFRIEKVSARTDSWFTGLMQMLDAGGLLRGGAGLAGILEKLDFGEHRHELHSSVAMHRALAAQGPVQEEHAAYYFRYAQDHLDEGMTAVLLQYELSLIDAQAIDALGKRFVLAPGR